MSQKQGHQHRGARPGLRAGLLAVCLLVTALFSAGSLAAAPGAQHLVYLPVLMDNFQGGGAAAIGISGKVTDRNSAAPGVALDLRRYDGSDEITVKSTTTNGQGAYLFSGVPALGAGEIYYVRYGPNDDNDTRLYYWFGPNITSYVSGTAISGSDFDIGDVVLLKPDSGATVTLPVTFQWQRRGVAGDDYMIELYDPDRGDSWVTRHLGDVGSFTSTNLPPAIVAGQTYRWAMIVFHGEDAYGYSYWYNEIIFSSVALQQPDGGGKMQWRHGGAPGKGRTTTAHGR